MAGPSCPGEIVALVERHRRATRLAVQRAAADLFEEHGCEAVSFEQVAAAAGISTSALRRYCDTAEDAATCHLVTAAGDLADAVSRRRGASLLRAVHEGVQEVFATVEAPALDLRRMIVVCLDQPPLTRRWLAAGREGQLRLAEVIAGRSSGPGTAAAEAQAGAVMAAVLTASEHWALDGGSLPGHLADCFSAIEVLDVPFGSA